MAEHSDIEWTDATWNPITGCSIHSPGCMHCYAMTLAATRLRNHPSRRGLTQDSKAGPVWTGEVRFNEQWLDQPLKWARPRNIFVCAHGDLFHESVPDSWIDVVFAVMALAPQHTFQVLTKRAKRMRDYCVKTSRRTINGHIWAMRGRDAELMTWPLPNVWLGVSAERQQEADERIPHLLAAPAGVRFVSLEPLLGPIDLTRIRVQLEGESWMQRSALHARDNLNLGQDERRLDWVIVGGESGRDARPMKPAWARALRDQCAEYAAPFFFKRRVV